MDFALKPQAWPPFVLAGLPLEGYSSMSTHVGARDAFLSETVNASVAGRTLLSFRRQVRLKPKDEGSKDGVFWPCRTLYPLTNSNGKDVHVPKVKVKSRQALASGNSKRPWASAAGLSDRSLPSSLGPGSTRGGILLL